MLAGISVDYLVRLEQGRGPTPSEQVLAALARALRLNDDERDHIFNLAGWSAPRPGLVNGVVRPSTQRVLDRMTDASGDVATAGSEVLTAARIAGVDPIPLMDFIGAIEQAIGREAVKELLPLQDGDVPATHADVEELAAWTGFRPAMPVPEGIRRFVAWYRDYYKV